jgi:hypothetical protein
MKRMISVLATALLAVSLLTVQAEARGGGGGGGGHAGGIGGGFGGGAHIGGLGGGAHIAGLGGVGGAYIGGVGHVGGLGGTHIGAVETGGVGAGVHAGISGDHMNRFDGTRSDGDHRRFAMHRLDRIYPYYEGGCYNWYVLHPDTTPPAYCS